MLSLTNNNFYFKARNENGNIRFAKGTEGYVPYGWIFPDEECAVLSQKMGKLSIFRLVNYHDFATTESIDSDKFIEFVDRSSMPNSIELVLYSTYIQKAEKRNDARNGTNIDYSYSTVPFIPLSTT